MSETPENSGEYGPIPKTRYNVRSLEADNGKAKTSDNQVVNMTFEIFGSTVGKRRIWDTMAWVPAMHWKMIDILKASGSPLVTEKLGIGAFVTEINKGVSFNVLVENESYKKKDGSTGNKLKMSSFKPLPEGVTAPGRNTAETSLFS